MNKHNCILLFAVIFLAIISLTSCKKTAPNIFNMFDVTVDLHQNSPYSLKESQTLNEGDSIYFDFTINSPTKEMYQVAIYNIANNLPSLRINLSDANRHTYTGIVKGIVGTNGFGTLRGGANTFRIMAYDSKGIYVGDGYKKISINVSNKMNHIVNRKIYFPDVDSANGSANAYISLTTGETFNYQTGAANSAKIDLGIYRVGGTGINNKALRFYSLSASPLPFTVFNISGWTQRTTKFSNSQSGQNSNFLTNWNTAAALVTYAKSRNPNLAASTSNIDVNHGVAFVTPEGKYGVILVNQISPAGEKPFIDVSIKYEL